MAPTTSPSAWAEGAWGAPLLAAMAGLAAMRLDARLVAAGMLTAAVIGCVGWLMAAG